MRAMENLTADAPGRLSGLTFAQPAGGNTVTETRTRCGDQG